MREQKETVNLSSPDKKNTQRIMGGSLDVAQKIYNFVLGWYFLDNKKYL